jgi:pimeloyl-ACP methyl ester carboxylesterase
VERQVTWRNGDVTLTGTLVLPTAGGPHPLVVFLHGSGPTDRRHYGLPVHLPMPYLYPQVGVASLIYDKRGTGQSTGSLNTAGLEDLAADALAAVEALRTHPDIDAGRIGLWGISQGGWLAPLVASRAPAVGFLVLVSAPAGTVEQQELDRVEWTLRAGRFGEEAVREALTHTRLFFDVVRTDAGWEELQASTDRNKDSDWFRRARPPQGKGGVEWYRRWQYDPTPVLRRTTCPVLALYGELDLLVPPRRNAPALVAALNEAGNGDYTVRVLPRASHLLLRTDPATWAQEPWEKAFVPGGIRHMLAWVTEHTVNGRTAD